MKANQIIDVLNQFKESSYEKILIDGNWGIGKTKYVLDFSLEHGNVCYISLFGKKDIDSVFQEIYIQLTENETYKKHVRKFGEKLNDLNISFQGFSFSIPLIKDIQTAVETEVGKKKTIVIIIDDLERKHHDLDIKEIFGLIDSLTKIDTKIVLVAARDKIIGKDNEIFLDYQEKAIDRIYKIENFSDNAPINILGEDIWGVLDKNAEKLKFKNLRTYEKTSLFIEEVINVLGNNIFSEKFIKEDLYRMCFATVFFYIEHNKKLKFINEEKSELLSIHFSDENNLPEYLMRYILNNSIENEMNKLIFQHIINWYETGSYCKDAILNIITTINNYEKKPYTFYLSEEEVIEYITNSIEVIENLDGNENLQIVIDEFLKAQDWANELDIDFRIGNKKLLELVKKNISNRINLETPLYLQEIYYSNNLEISNENATGLINLINSEIKKEYYIQLTGKIKACFIQKSFNNMIYLRQLNELINTRTDKEIQDIVLNIINDNSYLFPIPKGRINEEIWTWCHQVKILIKNIEQFWGYENYFEEFKSYIYSVEGITKDKMALYRLKYIFKEE